MADKGLEIQDSSHNFPRLEIELSTNRFDCSTPNSLGYIGRFIPAQGYRLCAQESRLLQRRIVDRLSRSSSFRFSSADQT